MACSLPQFILLKSNKRDKYLRYRKEDDSNHAFLQFSGDEKDEDVEIQYVKYEVQKSESMEGFVHIRSCYNNKYWVRKSGDECKSWIAVEASEPEEDPSKLSCTLFKPVLVDDADVDDQDGDKPQKIRLVHVDQVGEEVCVAQPESELLTLQGSHVEDEDDVFIAYNAASAFRLPDRVAFTNHEGKYAGQVLIDNRYTYVSFNTNDIGQEGVAIQPRQWPLANPPYIECRHINPFGWWQLNDDGNLVRIQAIGPPLYVTPIRLAGNKIALRFRDSWGRFLQSVSGNGGHQQLGTTGTSIAASAMFGVEEPVLFRAVSEVEYNLEDSRVYNVGSVEKYKDERWNTSSVEQTGSFTVTYTKSRTMTWGDSVSLTTGVTASMSASVPFVGVEFGVSLSTESSHTVEFGKEEAEEESVEYVQNLTIPPGKKITLLVVATRAQCDVPFMCRVVDTLSNGTIRRYTKTDGLFTGANEFSFQTRILEDNI